MKKITFLTLFFVASFTTKAQTGIDVPAMTVCDTQIQNFMNTFDIPGLTFAMAKEGELKYMRGFGNANIDGNKATQPYHMFRIGSISKPITSIAIMKMVENNLINLSDQVFGAGGILENHWYIQNSTITDTRVYDIKVQHLLEHSAGWDRSIDCFPNPASPYVVSTVGLGCDPIIGPLHVTESQGVSNPVQTEHFVKFLLEKNLNFTPGTDFAYSNVGFMVLSEIIEEVSGMDYESYVQQEVLNPIGIYDMHIAKDLLEDKKEREGEYLGNGETTLDLYGSGEYVPFEYGGFSLNATNGAGAWIATARDLVRLLVAVDGFSTKPDILLPETVNTMVTPSINNINYAKGWAVNSVNNWWHSGAFPGSASMFLRSNSGYTWALILNKRVVGGTANAFWTAIDQIGWDCIVPSFLLPEHDLIDSPTLNASNVTATVSNSTTLDANWTNGNGTSRLVVAKEISEVTGNYNFSAYPLDGIDYTANNQFGTGDNLGDDSYVMYNGTGTSVSLEGLDPNGSYAIRVYEYTKNTNNGNYALYLLGNVAETTSELLSIEENSLANQLKVYPNPSSGIFTLKNRNNIDLTNATIYDINGRQVKSLNLENMQDRMAIDLSHVASGMYFMHVSSTTANHVVKLVKE